MFFSSILCECFCLFSRANNTSQKKNSKQSQQRPDRLVQRLKSTETSNARMPVIRQPRGPDGTRGFKLTRFANSVPIIHSISN